MSQSTGPTPPPVSYHPPPGSRPAKQSNTVLWVILSVVGAFGCLAFVGIISAIFIPNFVDALHKARVKRTMADVQAIGTEVTLWSLDRRDSTTAVPASVLDGDRVRLDQIGQPLSQTELTAILAGSEVAASERLVDGWKNPLEVRISAGGMTVSIRSPGRDGTFESDSYVAGTFTRTDYDQDLVWVGGKFVRQPASR